MYEEWPILYIHMAYTNPYLCVHTFLTTWMGQSWASWASRGWIPWGKVFDVKNISWNGVTKDMEYFIICTKKFEFFWRLYMMEKLCQFGSWLIKGLIWHIQFISRYNILCGMNHLHVGNEAFMCCLWHQLCNHGKILKFRIFDHHYKTDCH